MTKHGNPTMAKANASKAEAAKCVDEIMSRIEHDLVKKRMAYSEYYEPDLAVKKARSR